MELVTRADERYPGNDIRYKNLTVCAHGNSLRALIKYIDNLNDEDVIKPEIPTATPLVYELDVELNRLRH